MMNKLYYMEPSMLEELNQTIDKAQQGIDLTYYINTRKEMTVDDGIATIDIRGALMDDAPAIYTDLGCTDYRDVASDINQALEQGVRGILLTINSGGGTVSGCEELATQIANIPVPTVTYYDGLGCSAAYKTGCGADYIVARPSAQIGNIGTILSYVDQSKAYAAMGVKFEAITNDGAVLKDTFHRLPLTDVQKEFLQDNINEAGKKFQDHVLAERPNLDTEVFNAQWASGQKAVDLGLADLIGTKDDALDALNQLISLINN